MFKVRINLGLVPDLAKVSAPAKPLPIYDVTRGQFFWQPGQGFSLGTPPREPAPNSVISMWGCTPLRGNQWFIWPNDTTVYWHVAPEGLRDMLRHLSGMRLAEQDFWMLAPVGSIRHEATVRRPSSQPDSQWTLRKRLYSHGGAPAKDLAEPLLHSKGGLASVSMDESLEVRFHPEMNPRDFLEL